MESHRGTLSFATAVVRVALLVCCGPWTMCHREVQGDTHAGQVTQEFSTKSLGLLA